jgi:TP901 family phage tail tape measure protein
MADRNLRIRVLMEGADRLTRPMREAAAGSTRLAQTLRTTRERLQGLQRAQAELGEFRQLRTGMRDTERRMREAQTRASALGRELAQTSNPTRRLREEFARARREAETLNNQHRQQSTRLQELRTRLSNAGISTRDLVSGERQLRDQIRQTNDSLREQDRRLQEVTQRGRRFADARDRFSRTQSTATGMAAGGAAAIGTGIAIARPLEGAAEDAMQFESVMTDINQKVNQARSGGAAMGLELRRTALAVNQMPADLQRGVDTLTGFGLAGREAVAMMKPIGRAATAYKAEIDDLGRATFAAHDNLKVPISQTSKALDVMARAGKSGAFEVRDMAQYFPQLTASMQSLGAKGVPAVADLASALQITRKGAGDSSTAANNLMNLLSKMNAEDTIKSFKELGVDVPAALKKAVKEGRSPLEEFIRLTEKVTGGDQSKLSQLFGDMQVQQAIRPLMANLKEYQNIRSEALAASGTVNADFDERMKDSAEKVRQLRIQAGDLSITLGNQLLPLIASIAPKLSAGAKAFAAFADRHPGLIRAAGVATAVLAALFLVLGGGAIVLAGIVAPIAVLGAAATALGIGLLPLIGIAALVVAGIAALAAVSYWLYENWGNWPKIMEGIFTALKFTFLNFNPLSLMVRAFTPAINYLRSLNWASIGRFLVQGLINGIISSIPGLRAAMSLIGKVMPDSLRKKLAIHSPSRVFATIGGHVMAGLDRGLVANTSGPISRIADLSAQMTRALAVGTGMGAMAIAAPLATAAPTNGPGATSTKSAPQSSSSLRSASSTRAGDTYHFHFTGVSGDPESIRDAVKKAMEQIEREKRGRGFDDGDD